MFQGFAADTSIEVSLLENGVQPTAEALGDKPRLRSSPQYVKSCRSRIFYFQNLPSYFNKLQNTTLSQGACVMVYMGAYLYSPGGYVSRFLHFDNCHCHKLVGLCLGFRYG